MEECLQQEPVGKTMIYYNPPSQNEYLIPEVLL